MFSISKIEAFSENLDVETESSVSFNNVSYSKGIAIKHDVASTFSFKKGSYKVTMTANVTAKTTGLLALQLVSGNDKVPQAVAGESATDTQCMHNLCFTTIMTVPTTEILHAYVQNIGVPVHVDTVALVMERL